MLSSKIFVILAEILYINMDNTDVQQVKLRFGIIGNNEGLNRAIDVALQVAHTDLSVLITGESGVGKENFPKIIHLYSQRKHGKYIAVNCGAIPEGTIDSELFGHEKGSFTGAISERNGYFAEADGGTIFLDEVGELPLPTQARLLRVLESGEYIKVGSSKVEKTNVRIVAATNVKLDEAIAEGRFREDLYYRLCTIPIILPPLRDRVGDIALLFRKFATDCAERYQMPSVQLSEDAKNMLESYTWPGNIRQLKNIAEQISTLESDRNITSVTLKKYLPPVSSKLPALFSKSEGEQDFGNEREILYKVLFDMRKDITDLKGLVNGIMSGKKVAESQNVTAVAPVPHVDQVSTINVPNTIPQKHNETNIQDTEEYIEEALTLDEVEREMIEKALVRNHGKRKDAAKDLNISERTLYRKIKEYGLEKINK